MAAEYTPIGSNCPDARDSYRNSTQEDQIVNVPMPLHIEDERNEWLRTLMITD